jgi:biopolymer transport protein ExbB/TolQ
LELLKQGGVVMYPLGLCSVLTVAIMLERFRVFRRADRDPEDLLARAQAALAGATNPEQRWPDHSTPASRLAAAALSMKGRARNVVEDHLRSVLTGEALRLSAHLGIVGTIGNIAPFVGLFGTVLGIIRAFRDIGEVGAAGPAVVATGISEALIATAAGLFVAITAVIVYNAFVIWQGRILRRADIVASELLNLATEGS